jgi:uncharacterized membrane protein YdbT with pleckstrin-like domain
MERSLKYRTSRISFLENYILTIIILILLLLVFPSLQIYENYIHYFLFFITIIFVAALINEPEIKRYFTTYFVSNSEVALIKGIIRKNKVSVPHANITSVNYSKGILGRIFNFGDVIINSSSATIKMEGVRNPEEIVRIIENKISLVAKGIEEREVRKKEKKKKSKKEENEDEL